MGNEIDISSSDLAKPAGQLLGDGLVKLAGACVGVAVTGFGVWMLTIHTSLATLDVKLDQINRSIAQAADEAGSATNLARDNSRRLDRIEATRFTDSDAAKVIAPLEHRLDRLESSRRR